MYICQKSLVHPSNWESGLLSKKILKKCCFLDKYDFPNTVYLPSDWRNLAGTGMLQVGQFSVEPWWKAAVVVKVSTMVARQTGDLLPSPRCRFSQGIGDTCK